MTVKPLKEVGDGTGIWRVYSPDDTGLVAVTLTDPETGVMLATTIANPEKRTAAHGAWAGARHSRAPGDTVQILTEMGERGIDPDQKLEEMFKNYGHASVADMARLTVHFNNVPMHVPLAIFNEGTINSGQEKSTRYQAEFGGALLHPLKNYLPEIPQATLDRLEEAYQKLGARSLSIFNNNKEPITKAYTDFYRPETTAQERSLGSRVLDTLRFSLLLGQSSGFAFETSARDWSRLVAHLKASPTSFYRRIGKQLEAFLSPTEKVEQDLGFKAEAPSLLRHTEPDERVRNSLLELEGGLKKTDLFQSLKIKLTRPAFQKPGAYAIPRQYSSAARMVAQYISSLFPGADYKQVLSWVQGLPDETKKSISKIIYGHHTHHNELPVQFAKTSDVSIIFECALGEVRDFNRHRAWGRYLQHIPLYCGKPIDYSTVEQIISAGYFLPSYLTDVPMFKDIRANFERDLQEYYSELLKFIKEVKDELGKIDYAFAINLLPLAHRSNIWMHGDPKQAHYFSLLRVRPGGHINYRILAYEASKALAALDPFLTGVALPEKPDAGNREEFFSRS